METVNNLSLVEVVRKFSDERDAEEWWIANRWVDGIRCPRCEGDRIRVVDDRKPMPFYCNVCRRYFSTKTGTVMEASNLPLGKWAIAIYLFNVNPKGISARRLQSLLGVSYRTAWHMAHRIRDMWDVYGPKFEGTVEVDETYVGGKEGNKHWNKKLRVSGTGQKVPVVGMRERETGLVRAEVVERTDRRTLVSFVHRNTRLRTTIHTDEAPAYRSVRRPHETVNHSRHRYVDGDVTTNGIESFWAVLKRGYSTYHSWSRKHLHRYVREFVGRHNLRGLDVETRMEVVAVGAVGKRLRYRDLIAE